MLPNGMPGPMQQLYEQQNREIVPCKLFVGGLSYDSTDASLAAYFNQFGPVASASVLRDPVTSHSRGFGFVTFTDESSAHRVLAQSRNHIVDGRKVEAKLAFPKQSQPKVAYDRPDAPNIDAYSQFGLGLNLAQDHYSQQLGVGFEGNPMFSNMNYSRDMYGMGMPSQQQYYPNMDIYDQKIGTMNGFNNLSATVSSQSFPSEGSQRRSPRASVIEPESYRQTDIQNLRRKTLSHIHLEKDLQGGFRGVSELDKVTGQLSSLNVQNSQRNKSKKILIFDLGIDAKAKDLSTFCSTFGKVEEANITDEGYGEVVFFESKSVETMLNCQKVSGNLFFNNREITLAVDYKHIDDNKYEENTFERSNSHPLELESEDIIQKESRKIPLLRAMSVTQSMLIQTNEEDYQNHNRVSMSSNLLRHDKNRSLSVIASANNGNPGLFRANSDGGGRRSSSFGEVNQTNLLEQNEK